MTSLKRLDEDHDEKGEAGSDHHSDGGSRQPSATNNSSTTTSQSKNHFEIAGTRDDADEQASKSEKGIGKDNEVDQNMIDKSVTGVVASVMPPTLRRALHLPQATNPARASPHVFLQQQSANTADDVLVHAPEEDDSAMPSQAALTRVHVGAVRVVLQRSRNEAEDDVLAHAPEEDHPDVSLEQAAQITLRSTTMVEGELIPEAQVMERKRNEGTDEGRRQRRKFLLINSLVGVVVLVVCVAVGVRLGRRNGEPTGISKPPPTLSPTSILSEQPTLTLASRIQSYSPWTTFEDPSSGQSRALDWISTDERSLGMESDALFLQRFALAVLHFSTNGEVWGLLSEPDDFLSENGECTGRDGENDGPPNLSCDVEGFVTEIDLNNMNGLQPADYVGGSFPPEVALLTRLTVFQARDNDWTGTLPTQIGIMTALQIFDLSRTNRKLNGMVGRLPTEIGNMGSLKILNLAGRRFQLPITSELWQLTKLTHLALGTTSASPFPSEVGLLSALTALSMTDGLSGPIPTEIGQLSLASAIDRMWNISGTLPSEIGRLTELQSFLVVSSPNLVGPIPSEFGRLAKLTMLQVQDTSLSGKLPSEIGMMTSLTNCGLRVSGELPSEIGLLTQLAHAAFNQSTSAGAKFSPLPSEFGLLLNLWLLEVNGVLSGTLPSEIGTLETLRFLYLFTNRLVGPLPSELFSLSNLAILDLSENDLQSSIPSEIELWSSANIDSLNLEGCNLTGTIPTEVSSLTDLSQLRLANNPSLTGQLPSMSGLLLEAFTLHGTGLNDTIDCDNFTRAPRFWSVDIRNVASSSVQYCRTELSPSFCQLECPNSGW